MSVEPDSESLELFPSETSAPLGNAHPRRHLQRARGIVVTLAVFALGVLTGTYINVTSEHAPQAVAAPALDLSPTDAARAPDPSPDNAPSEDLPLIPNTALPALAPLRAALTPVRVTTPGRASVAAERLRRSNDVRAIQTVLNRYRDAVSTLDPAAVRAVWPTVNLNLVRSEFAGLAEQNIDFERCRISSSGPRAAAVCAGIVESGFVAGDRRPRSEKKRWEFTLRRTGERWTILAVRTQPG
jgi:hypothetical protein